MSPATQRQVLGLKSPCGWCVLGCGYHAGCSELKLVLSKQGTGEAIFGTAMARNYPQWLSTAIWNPMRPTGDAIYALGAHKSR